MAAEAINIFAQNLPSDENLYVFPPFVLIGPLINFFKSMKIRLSIVVPNVSPRKFWWPIIEFYMRGPFSHWEERTKGCLDVSSKKEDWMALKTTPLGFIWI